MNADIGTHPFARQPGRLPHNTGVATRGHCGAAVSAAQCGRDARTTKLSKSFVRRRRLRKVSVRRRCHLSHCLSSIPSGREKPAGQQCDGWHLSGRTSGKPICLGVVTAHSPFRAEQPQHLPNVVPGLRIRRHAIVTLDGGCAGVVGGQRQRQRVEAIEHDP